MKLHTIGLKHKTDKATFHNFCDFYEEHLPKKVTRLLEIGIMDGASLRMWKEYYPDAEIIGVDISEPKNIEGVTCLKIDATTVEIQKLGVFDIIIDDGSHMTQDQQDTFDLLYKNNLAEHGIYIMEDLHTSFMPNYTNSEKTTYEVLQESNDLDITYWSRTDNKAESFTAIIKK